MTLAQRLLLAIGVLTVATTGALGFGVREAWRRAEEERFQQNFHQAFDRLERELSRQIKDLPALIEPLCAQHPLVDSTIVDLRAGRLGPGRRLSISERVPLLMRGLSLDELVLVTGTGEILGAGDKSLVGKTNRELGARLTRPSRPATLRDKQRPLAVESHCVRRSGNVSVGIYAARHVESLLELVASSHGMELSLTPGRSGPDEMVRTMRLAELGGLTVVAKRSRVPLRSAMRQLDWTILLIGGGVFGAGILIAMLMSRGLARPIVRLSDQAKEVVAGDPKPVKATGGRELRELAESFNKAIADLTAMRKRLAATERIAARREIARQVAHEIKNPLAPIQASVETLRRLRAREDPAFDEYFDEATRTVLDEVSRISNIVSEFTRFARLPPPNPAPMDLVETIRKVVGLHDTGSTDVVLDARECPTIQADRDQMVQVATNLIQNAIDAASSTARGVVTPKVTVEVYPRGAENVVLAVRDNGPGVAPEMKDRLFEPYATTKPEGTGLGLAIVQRIVLEHGGEIVYTDAEGGGAEFTITLPLSGPTLLPEPPATTPMTTPRPPGATS